MEKLAIHQNLGPHPPPLPSFILVVGLIPLIFDPLGPPPEPPLPPLPPWPLPLFISYDDLNGSDLFLFIESLGLVENIDTKKRYSKDSRCMKNSFALKRIFA